MCHIYIFHFFFDYNLLSRKKTDEKNPLNSLGDILYYYFHVWFVSKFIGM